MSLLALSTIELETLGRQIRQGVQSCPLAAEAPSLGGLARRAPLLFGHERAATLAIIDCAIAERRAPRPTIELVWTGPDSPASRSRDTAIVVREMLEGAQKSVLIAGYVFDHGGDILRPLHDAMMRRGVTAELFLDIARAASPVDLDAHIARHVEQFLDENWPFGNPLPTIYYAPFAVSGPEYASLHAKCAVVDDREVLVGSANFTARGRDRNVEVGVAPRHGCRSPCGAHAEVRARAQGRGQPRSS